MAKDRDGAMDALAKDIRRQIGTQANKTFLRRMPLFRVDAGLPEDLSVLLGELDVAEKRQRNASVPNASSRR
ncbi:MAG: hypothetical protein M9955_07805 [Rhizobiaceae bacterium]|nr:hypothetical protein [Rhizobiaceae bacterium]